jgi:hypothetical protein
MDSPFAEPDSSRTLAHVFADDAGGSRLARSNLGGLRRLRSVVLRSLLSTFVLVVAGCTSASNEIVPSDPGPVATEYFAGEIVWKVDYSESFDPSTLMPAATPLGADTGDMIVSVRGRYRAPAAPRLPALMQWVLLTRDDTAILLEGWLGATEPLRGGLSFGGGASLFLMDYPAATYRESAEDQARLARRAGVKQYAPRETAEKRVILGYVCTATVFPNASRTVKVWATKALKVNMRPLTLVTAGRENLGLMLANVRGVPLRIEISREVSIEATSITATPVDDRWFMSPVNALRRVD